MPKELSEVFVKFKLCKESQKLQKGKRPKSCVAATVTLCWGCSGVVRVWSFHHHPRILMSESDETKATCCRTDWGDKIGTFSSILVRRLVVTLVVLTILGGGLSEGGDSIRLLAGKRPGNALYVVAKPFTDFSLSNSGVLTMSSGRNCFLGYCVFVYCLSLHTDSSADHRLQKRRN